MKPEELRSRTKKFALDVLRLFRSLPKTEEARIIGRQLLRAAMSVAANYRAAGRARSRAEFVAKIGMVVEEADESVFWFEILRDGSVVAEPVIRPFLEEGNQLVAIFAASQNTARAQR